MDTKRRKVRCYVKEMPGVADYRAILAQVKLTAIERRVCDLRYLDGLSLMEIGDRLGYSESGVKRIHRHILEKISSVL